MLKRLDVPRFTIVVTFVLVVAGGFFLQYSRESSTEREQVKPSHSGNIIAFDYTDANGDYVAMPMFGSTDQVLIFKDVKLALSGFTNDFLSIGNVNADRESYWVDAGHSFSHPDRTWSVVIGDYGQVGGDTRVFVLADAVVNTTKSQMGKTFSTVDVDASLCELWKLNSGSAPELLERSEIPFDGVLTHTESPVELPADFSTEVFGNGLDFMGGKPFDPHVSGSDAY